MRVCVNRIDENKRPMRIEVTVEETNTELRDELQDKICEAVSGYSVKMSIPTMFLVMQPLIAFQATRDGESEAQVLAEIQDFYDDMVVQSKRLIKEHEAKIKAKS